jgi:5-methylcytosine-specific restriction protein A
MSTVIFTWNPNKWAWTSLDADVETCKRQSYFVDRWSCGVTRRIIPGDCAYLLKLGPEEPAGIMASGEVLTEPYQEEHFSDPTQKAWYVDVRFDILLHPQDEEILPRATLRDAVPNVHWKPQASGMTIPAEEAAMLHNLWSNHLLRIGLSGADPSVEVPNSTRYWEGAIRKISVDAYERDPRARQSCVLQHGYCCAICGFDFETAYGEVGKHFVHVHHLRPLAEVGNSYFVDPTKDLLPVCPNCHAMLHRRTPAFSPDELKIMMRSIPGR